MSKSLVCIGSKIKQFYLKRKSKLFRKCKGQLTSNRELIFWDPTHIYLFSVSFFKKLEIVN